MDAGHWLLLISSSKVKNGCNIGSKRAHPYLREKSSGNSETDEVRVVGSGFYTGRVGESVQPSLPGKSGLGFQPRPGAPSGLGLRESMLGQQL